MIGSLVFVLHVLGLGLLAGVTFAGWIVNMRFTSEPELQIKLVVGGLMRTIGLFSPIAALLLLLTGIGNIHNLFAGNAAQWYKESWLIAKVVLFGILLTNGTLLGPSIARKRMKILRSWDEEEQEVPSGEELLKHLNSQMRWFYAVQIVLIVCIIALSVFGVAKH